MKIRTLVAIAAVTSSAIFISISANAADGRELILSAPIQKLDRGDQTVTILGQSFHTDVANLNIGEVAKVYGVLQKDGSISDSVVEGTGTYGANGDSVFLKGIVTASDAAMGHVDIDGMTIDYTSQLANGNFTMPNVGDTIAFSGSQPAAQGVLVASATGANAYPVAASASALPSQRMTSGLQSAEIVSTGLNTSEIVGTGINSSEIVGTGLNTSEIVGTGINSSEIVGTGLNTASASAGRR